MTHHPDHDATDSWSRCRKAFAHRAAQLPALGLIPPLIDWLVEQGIALELFASSSLDNLVISDAADWRKRTQAIVVIPKKSTVEIRYYRRRELVEQCEVSSEYVYKELDRLLPQLLVNDQQP
jgi:hypothetical protein